jgi:hypothetical protein
MAEGFFPPEEYESCRRSLVHGLGLSEEEANNILSASEQLALACISNPQPGDLTNKVALWASLYQFGVSLDQIKINIEMAFQKMAASANERMLTFITHIEESGIADALIQLNEPEKKLKGKNDKLLQAYYRRLKR